MHSKYQHVLNYTLHNKYAEEDFITSSTNAKIYTSVTDCTKFWGVEPYSKSLILIGPKSSGKTHLAHIWKSKFGSRFLTSQEVDRLEAPGYIIEDITSFRDEDLLHLFNRINEAKKYLLMTSETKPSFALRDLQSRLNSVNTLYLDLPDEDMTKILLMHHFTTRSLKVPLEVIEYLAKRVTRDYHAIHIFVEELDHFALASKRVITIPLIAQFLKIQNHDI